MKPIGIFGGTFDPVHCGHLRTCVELYETLDLHQVRLIPCGNPPHRAVPLANVGQRASMLRLAIAGQEGLCLDERELDRAGPSYMVDTLTTLREEFPAVSLCLILGSDAFLGLHSWRRWRELFRLAHLVVVPRHGWSLAEGIDVPGRTNAAGARMNRYQRTRRSGQDGTEINMTIAKLLAERCVDDKAKLHEHPAGHILICQTTVLDISSSKIRALIRHGGNPRYLLPRSVGDFILAQEIYR